MLVGMQQNQDAADLFSTIGRMLSPHSPLPSSPTQYVPHSPFLPRRGRLDHQLETAHAVFLVLGYTGLDASVEWGQRLLGGLSLEARQCALGR